MINVNKAYVHDFFGRVGVSNESDAANVFTTGETPEDLVRVGIYTEGEGTYKLEVYSGNACEAGSGATLLASKDIPGTPQGYRTFDFTGNSITFQPNTTFTVMLHSLGAGELTSWLSIPPNRVIPVHPQLDRVKAITSMTIWADGKMLTLTSA